MSESTFAQPWVNLHEVAALLGLTYGAAKNKISRGNFPVAHYRLGKLLVVDREVLAAFFDEKKAAGLAQLEASRKPKPVALSRAARLVRDQVEALPAPVRRRARTARHR
jgi:hypothetical protein